MATLPENTSVAIDELESAIIEMESRLESAQAERSQAEARQVELEIENANLRREIDRARERQNASADILGAIAGAPSEADQSLQRIAETTARLFGAPSVTIRLAEGAEWGKLINYGASSHRVRETVPEEQRRLVGDNLAGTVYRENRQIHIPDLDNIDSSMAHWPVVAARAEGARTVSGTPLRREGKAIGAMVVFRDRLAPFTDEELALQQSFADQAVIAIENARLFNETRETLERQTATADVLNVISRSPTDAGPVFDVIGERAEKLCNAEISVISVVDGDLIRVAGIRGISREGVELFRANFPMPVNRQTVTARTIKSGTVVHTSDVLADTTYDNKGLAAQTGYRSCLGVPMHYEGEIVGAIFVARTDPGLFSDSQIRLLEIFADQAVIAIQNVRLFNETREALEQQKASADILRVISSSVASTQPAFSKILESCKHLFGSDETAVLLVDDEDSVSLGAYVGEQHDAVAATFPAPVDKSAAGRAIRERRVMHYTDVASNPQLTRAVRHVARLAGYESMAYAPMLWNERGIGAIGVSRTKGTFSDKELALLQTFADQAVIAIQNSRLFNETQEALERQTATAEILKVIASSPSDVLPVFEAIVSSAKRLLGGFSAAVFRFTEGIAHLEAMTPTNPAADEIMKNSFPRPVTDFQSFAMAQAGRIVQTPDTDALSDEIRDIARARGFRSMLIAPLLREGTPIGLISVTRVEPGPFSAHFVQLLQTFADQAVIAIRNVGLFNEVQARTEDLSESLRQQTAVGDVLKTISRSTFHLQPVLDTLVNSAAQLCDADMAFIMRRVGDEYRAGAAVGYTEAYIDFLSNNPLTVDRGTVTGRTVLERRPVQIPDVLADPEYTLSTRAGQRTTLGVPLLRENEPIGVIVLARQRVQPFTQKQIDLVATFADQAVIAIENVRLFNEVQQRTEDLSEALQQQTATADVLKLISRSAFDLQTVLDTLTESAARLCNADMGAIALRDERGFYHATNYNFSVDWIKLTDNLRLQPGRESLIGRTLLARTVVQIEDVLADPDYQFPDMQMAAGYRSLLGVPLMRGGEPIGVLFLGRKTVESYSDKQTELVSTFADQAVIAIENVRLFDEVQAKTRDLSEALTYQTGSANILKVIASSPTDVGPVLKAIVESACELCEAYDSIAFLKEGDYLRFSAHHGPIPMDLEKWPINRMWVTGRAVVDQRPVHVHDLMAEGDEFPDGRDMSARMGHRTIVAVPLLREGDSIGAIILRRTEVNPFSDKQINLLQTFADQAVIAIGNVRLFKEVQAKTRDLSEALTHQTGSANILKVIASSPTDINPVLQAIVESACQLCDAYDAVVRLKEGDNLRFYAHHGPLSVTVDNWPINRSWTAGRAVIDQKPVQVRDLLSAEGDEFPEAQKLGREKGQRTIMSVPLLRDGEGLGAITLRRLEVNPFTDKQIALLQTFADQAVIAIGNVRLFEEVQARTRDLQEALTYQTGSANILKVIASSPTDIDPVLQSIVESACELCAASDAVVLLRDGDDLRFRAHHGPIEINVEKWPIGRDWAAGRAFLDQTTVHVNDVFSEPEFGSSRELSRHTRGNGIRSVLSVPLLREGESVGVLTLRRQEINPFSDKQINLLRTFADQAVIAIGNVHLFEEVQARTRELTESLKQQTATSEVLQAISSSQGDLAPVFDAMLDKSMQLCGADFGVLNTYDGSRFHTAATHGLPPAYDAFRRRQPLDCGPGTAPARLLQGEAHVEILHLLDSEAYRRGDPNRRALVDIGGARSLLAVPLLKDKRVVGNVMIFRQEDSPFSEKQIALLKQFAAQAVIAIENARLLNELRQRTHDLSKSLDDLRAAQDRLVQTEKLASLGQLTAGIAHEIKNPLNFVNNFAALSTELAEELNDALKQAEVGEKIRAEVDELTALLMSNLEKIVQHGKRADSIVKNMLLHSRERGGEHRPSDINALIDESLNLAYHGARAEKPGFNVTLERDFDPAAGQVDLFPQEITRVFLNLVSNGFYAVTKRKKEGGEPGFEPTLRASTRNLGGAVEIRIRDNGTGIPPEVREKMFNPFFTTKPAGEGTGLGLSMSHDIIVKQHGGTIDVDTEQGRFTEFRIVLPRTSNFAKKS